MRSSVKTFVIIVLLLVIAVGAVGVYFAFVNPIQLPTEKTPSGAISSGDDVTSGDIDIPSGDDAVPPVDEEPEEPGMLSATIPFDTFFAGSDSFTVGYFSDEVHSQVLDGEEFSFVLIVDTDKDIVFEIDSSSEDYVKIEADALEKNKFIVTFCWYYGEVHFAENDGENDFGIGTYMTVNFIVNNDFGVAFIK